MRRGEVWWADLQGQAGRRPVLLLSRNAVYNTRTHITVATITRTIRNIPVEVTLDQSDGMTAQCVVNLDNIITIPKSQLLDRITELSQDKLNAVTVAAIFALDLRV